MAAPPLDPQSRAVLTLAVLSARNTIPDLVVTITPNTGGRQWLVDRCCNRIWLSDRLNPRQYLAAVGDALRVLHAGRVNGDAPDWLPRQRGTALPAGR